MVLPISVLVWIAGVRVRLVLSGAFVRRLVLGRSTVEIIVDRKALCRDFVALWRSYSRK